MTTGYFVQESAGKVVKAAYLSDYAYLQGGWGETIIDAFSRSEEQNLLPFSRMPCSRIQTHPAGMVSENKTV